MTQKDCSSLCPATSIDLNIFPETVRISRRPCYDDVTQYWYRATLHCHTSGSTLTVQLTAKHYNYDLGPRSQERKLGFQHTMISLLSILQNWVRLSQTGLHCQESLGAKSWLDQSTTSYPILVWCGSKHNYTSVQIQI